MDRTFLDLLLEHADAARFDEPLIEARARGLADDQLADLEAERQRALALRERLAKHQFNEGALRLLNDTANDLATLRDLDRILDAIVARARRLVESDLAYISLNDDETGDSYIKAMTGHVTTLMPDLRLPSGTGLGGKVARAGAPCSTTNYLEDSTLVHVENIDHAVTAEGIVALVGVPLRREGRVCGVLLAAQREPRTFSGSEVGALAMLASHAAVAIENARLLAQSSAHTETLEQAAETHLRLTQLVLRGGGIDDVVQATADSVSGVVALYDDQHAPMSVAGGAEPTSESRQLADLIHAACGTGETLLNGELCVVPMITETGALGALVHWGSGQLTEPARRSLERAALVASLLIVNRRRAAEAETRTRSALLEDLMGATSDELEAIGDRAALLGVDLTLPNVLLVVRGRPETRERLHATAEALARRSHGLVTPRRDDLVLLLPAHRDGGGRVARDSVHELSRAVGHAVTCGYAPVRAVEVTQSAYADADRCVHALIELGREGDTTTSEDLGFLGLLLAEHPDPQAFIDATLGALIDYDRERRTALLRTLEAYLDNGQSPSATAGVLHLHVNTVTQRLARITRLLGEAWREPARLLELQVALRIRQITRGGSTPSVRSG